LKWRIPGTVLQIEKENADGVEDMFSSMFLAGGMVLSQVANISGLEPYTIQNWVKRGFLSPPQHKRYSIDQLCRILQINMLKSVLSLEQICGLLSYINGRLDESSDDIIHDAHLYFLFVRLASRAKELDEPAAWEQALQGALSQYQEPVPGARDRIEKALRVMLTAWVAARMRRAAETMLQEV
jgi:DNA-binding transcriptional MerR regulator